MSAHVTADATADVVVVGAGAAGVVLASRLAAAGRSVILLEAGTWATGDPLVDHPSAWFGLQGGAFDYAYGTEPAPEVSGRSFTWPRGKGVGGSSLINGMIWLRGHRADYDGWAASGCTGWSWDELAPLFRRTERWTGEPAPFHGDAGEMTIVPLTAPSLAARAFVEAAEGCGFSMNPDFNSGDSFGSGYIPHSIRGTVRESVATAFLPGGAVPTGMTLYTGAQVQRLVIEGGRCVGVVYVRDGRRHEVHAGETIVSAGTVDSPKVLMLSGIGPARELERHGITTLVDAPVGANLQDHASAMVSVASTVDMDVDPHSPLGEAALFTHTAAGPAGGSPNLQVTIGARAQAHPSAPPEQGFPVPGFTVMPYLTRPQSRGRIALRSADPADPVTIHTGYLNDPADREVLRRGMELALDLCEQQPLLSISAGPVFPTTRPADDAGLDAAIKAGLFTFYHPVGTCRMGVGEDSVVDPELRVRGVDGLSVVDASVMPQIVSANTYAATVVIAERAAELRTA